MNSLKNNNYVSFGVESMKKSNNNTKKCNKYFTRTSNQLSN